MDNKKLLKLQVSELKISDYEELNNKLADTLKLINLMIDNIDFELEPCLGQSMERARDEIKFSKTIANDYLDIEPIEERITKSYLNIQTKENLMFSLGSMCVQLNNLIELDIVKKKSKISKSYLSN